VFFDMNYLLLVLLPTLVISGAVQAYLSSTYGKWSNVRNGAGVTGAQAAQAIFQRTELNPVQLIGVPGKLSDHFDPTKNVVGLSQGTAQGTSVASMAVAAHELGHVQQYQQKSPLMGLRSFLVPAVRLSPSVSYMLILFGLIFQFPGLAWMGVIVFGIAVIFMLVTVPVELNASNRAMRLLDEAGLLTTEEDRKGARSVLTAAGLTYVAAAVTSILQLLYYISLVQRSRR
jgi:Zn-dependent membrane protease YugP